MKEDPVRIAQPFRNNSTENFNTQKISLREAVPCPELKDLKESSHPDQRMEKTSDKSRDKENNITSNGRGRPVDAPQIAETPDASYQETDLDNLSLESRHDATSTSVTDTTIRSNSFKGRNNQSDDEESLSHSQTSSLQKEVTSHSVEMSVYKGQQVKIVTLQKNTEPLGATVCNDGEAVVIARIVKGGIAERTKLLKQGDEILLINDVDTRGKTIHEVADLMLSLTGKIRLVTKLASTAQIGTVTRHAPRRDITVRAQFDYDPSDDPFIPCVELGVSFQIGDILHVINREDPHWWQAYREGDDSDSLAGLIPSRLFWETREHVRRAILAETEEAVKQKKKLICFAGRRKPNNKRKLKSKYQYTNAGNSDDGLLTYEEVGTYFPLPNRKRPIVLVGCEELRLQKICERMVKIDKHRFAQPIRTSSHPSVFNADAPLLQFLPHDRFIERVRNGEFIEYKVVDTPEMHYDGVSKKAIKDVVDSGASCVMHCQPKNISKLRTADIKPYIVFMAAPPIQRLKDFLRSESTIEPSNDECKHIIDLSRHNESTYSYLYDLVMNLSDIDLACKELISEINKLDVEKQWVPIDWLPQINGKTNSNYVNVEHHGRSEVNARVPSVGSGSTRHSVLADVNLMEETSTISSETDEMYADCRSEPASPNSNHKPESSNVERGTDKARSLSNKSMSQESYVEIPIVHIDEPDSQWHSFESTTNDSGGRTKVKDVPYVTIKENWVEDL